MFAINSIQQTSKRVLLASALFLATYFSAVSVSQAQLNFSNADQALASTSVPFSLSKISLKVGVTYYISADRLNVRSSPVVGSPANILGQLELNDLVQIVVDIDPQLPVVEVKIIKSSNFQAEPNKTYFVSADYLSLEKVTPPPSDSDGLDADIPSNIFVIQNVATEKTRVYERCTATPDCPHRLIFETEMVVGRTTGTKDDPRAFLTWLGQYKIKGWTKFYEDGGGSYPSWYYPTYPEMPYNAGINDWLSNRYLPNGQGHWRGAFGWYTAFVGPNSNYQWLHGTFGWGHDKDKYIQYTRNPLVNLFSDPRSSGCTRHENMAIAYLREILPAGTDVMRVYALEATRDPSLSRYAAQRNPFSWEWILTKEGAQEDGPLAGKNDVLSRNVPDSLILEKGSYQGLQYPHPLGLGSTFLGGASSGKSGNTYKIKKNEFRGAYLVDEGRFVDYEHPATDQLTVGGFEGHVVPQYTRTTGSYTLAQPYRPPGAENSKDTSF